MMDYGYYLNEFGGSEIPEGAFSRMAEKAKHMLLSLIFPLSEADFSSSDEEMFRRAVCYQAEYLFSGKGEEDEVKRETVGDCTVEYRDSSKKKRVSVFGNEVSPAACHLLLASGLMLRWV